MPQISSIDCPKVVDLGHSTSRPALSPTASPFLTFTLFMSLVIASNTSYAASVSGKATVIDGDTLKIGAQVVRLYGIDAPENGQNCKRRNGKSYNCGAAAENALKALVASNTSCTGNTFDNYQRLIGVCESDGLELNKELVLTGHALAFRKFSDTYIQEEKQAAKSKQGIWQGSFENPWDFRAEKWNAASQAAPNPDCPIKGNINRKGDRIYHTPWSRSYKRTKINTEKSERWFCSEAEALAAGWRAPYR